MTSLYDQIILAEPSLTNFWPMSEPTGNSFADVKGGANGVNTGVAALGYTGPPQSFFDGDTCAGYYYTGPAGQGTMPSLGAVPSQFSVEFWTEPSLWAGDNTVYCRLSTNPSAPSSWNIGGYEGAMGLSGTNWPSGLTLSAWNYVAITYDGTNAKLYVNATLIGSIAVAPPSNWWPGIGYGSGFGFSGALWAYFCKLALYNAVLSPTQISDHYTGTLPAPSAPLSPVGLSATATKIMGATPADLSAGSVTYSVEYSTDGMTWDDGPTGLSASEGWTITGLLPQTAYIVRYVGVNPYGSTDGADSEPITTMSAGGIATLQYYGF